MCLLGMDGPLVRYFGAEKTPKGRGEMFRPLLYTFLTVMVDLESYLIVTIYRCTNQATL
jgi:hypothetical protein